MTLLNIGKQITIGTNKEITNEEEKEIYDLSRQVLKRRHEDRTVWLVGQCDKFEGEGDQMKWKCINCDNVFESDENDFIEDSDYHLLDCLRRDEFIIKL